MINAIFWKLQLFSELNTSEVYQILALRQQVFIVEQQDIYLDVDGKDLNATHVSGYDGKNLIAYARILYPTQENYVSFGRVIVDKAYRGKGLGKVLIEQILTHLQNGDYKNIPLKISAQTYLRGFYENFGFKPIGEIYLDGTIPHVDMVKE